MTVMRKQPGTPKDVLVVVLSNVDVGDPRCPIHDNDAIFTQTLIKKSHYKSTSITSTSGA